jgi:PilZ domain-containing protein
MLGAGAGSIFSYVLFRAHRAHYLPNATSDVAVDHTIQKHGSSYRMKALILSTNHESVAIFSQIFREIGIETQRSESEAYALERLMSEKFEALVLDFDDLASCGNVKAQLGSIRPNQNVAVVAIASDDGAKAAAVQSGTTFVIERPLIPVQLRSLLRTIYGRMVRSSQSYFRFNFQIPVSLVRELGNRVQCTTINLSHNGMAISTPEPLIPGESLRIAFLLPNTDSPINAEGTVIWDDAHGKAGIRFECSNTSATTRYFEWLQDHFYTRLEPPRCITETPSTAVYAN